MSDGDSLSVAGVRIRLFGVDAPELSQTCKIGENSWTCGADAKQYLVLLVAHKSIRCERRDTDAYGRTVATCMAGGVDLSRALVEAGLAVALPDFTDEYVEAERRARQFKVGIWNSTFVSPAEFRADNTRQAGATARNPRLPAASYVVRSTKPIQRGCAIKGNRNRKGQWIYHLPGMPYYDRTRPEEIFCTEAEAQAAGYRRAIVR